MISEGEHLFLLLMEEAAEVQQRVSKLLRFGHNEIQPGQPFTNADRLRAEIGDFLAILWLLDENGYLAQLSDNEVSIHIIAKRKKVEQYLKYSRALSRVEPAHETEATQVTTYEVGETSGVCKHCGLSWLLHIAEDDRGRKNVCAPIKRAESENDG